MVGAEFSSSGDNAASSLYPNSFTEIPSQWKLYIYIHTFSWHLFLNYPVFAIRASLSGVNGVRDFKSLKEF